MTLFFSSCEQALERSLAEDKVHIHLPVNNSTTTEKKPVFYWAEIEAATKYRLEVVAPQFGAITKLGIDTTITGNQFSFTKELSPDTYQWRVRALNAVSTSRYSDTFTITIQ